MTEIDRSALFAKLNASNYKAIEQAFFLAKLREHKYVELSHWLYQLSQQEQHDFHYIMQYFHIDIDEIQQDLLNALNRLKSGYSEVQDFSPDIERILTDVWLYCSLQEQQISIRGIYLLYVLVTSNEFYPQLIKLSTEFSKIKPDILLNDLHIICEKSLENQQNISILTTESTQYKNSALQQYGLNLTEQARLGKLDPVIARDHEIHQMMNILLRKKQNNPLLIGEAGVGKTAVVEGLAQKIAIGDVPNELKQVELILLDLGALKAGASVTGEFEKRLKAIIREINQSPYPIILFIDEIHTLIGAGGSAGTGDAANLIKPALARGELRTIGATTWVEYKKYFEKDAALTRRFQTVIVTEPDEETACTMLRRLVSYFEQHHHVTILDEAIIAAVKLSKRYLPTRQLPDKAISLLDSACAKVMLSQYVMPMRLTEIEQQLQALQLQQNYLVKQVDLGGSIDLHEQEQLQKKQQQLQYEQQQLVELYQQEKLLVNELRDIQQQLNTPDDIQLITVEREDLKAQQKNYLFQLQRLHQQSALVYPVVNAQLIAEVIAQWTGIPVGQMMGNEIEKVLDLAKYLQQRVIGQDQGLIAISQRIQTSRAQLDDPNKPIGVFMLAGPSGVGKTETALALAEMMYGGEQHLITINMSEYQEAHTVSSLKGAPPGYVGYGEGGILTEAVRRKPYSVILLDEIEKAHPDVHEIFFQVFDKGWMEDGEGRYIDFKNTIILLTSNVGSELILDLCQDELLKPDVEALAQALREPLLKVFPAALLGRLQVIPYYPLSTEMLSQIVELQLQRVMKRLKDNHHIQGHYTASVVDFIVKNCTEIESGGRMIERIITSQILPPMSMAILSHIGKDKKIISIGIDIEEQQFKFNIDTQ